MRIFEFQPAMMHAKTVWSTTPGRSSASANMDERSMELNEENVLGIADKEFATVHGERTHRGLRPLP